MPRHDIVTQLIDQIKDIERQLRALQRLDVTPPPASIVTYTGTPTSGQLAQWNGGGTLTHSGYAGSAVARYSGAPVTGNYSYWTAAGTIADSGFGTSQLPRYSGTPTAGRYPVWTAAGTIADSGFGTADLPRYTGTPSAGKYTYWTGAGTIAASTFGTADLPRYSGTPSAGNFAYWTGAGTVAGSGIGTASVARLDIPNTFALNQTLSGTATTGSLLSVTRNLAAASTNSPVVDIVQDHASDDQDTLRLQQDGSGKLIVAVDDGTEVFSLISAGSHTILSFDAIATKAALMTFKANGGNYQTTFGLAGASNNIFLGASAGDFAVRAADNQKLLLGVDNGSGNNSPAIYILESGFIGFGVASPQGRIHAHDGTAGFLFVSKTAINGTAQTIIPNGTGDVTLHLRYDIGLTDSAGTTTGSSGTLAGPSTSVTLSTSGGNTVDLRVNADGSVDIRRTAGSLTFTATLTLHWA